MRGDSFSMSPLVLIARTTVPFNKHVIPATKTNRQQKVDSNVAYCLFHNISEPLLLLYTLNRN